MPVLRVLLLRQLKILLLLMNAFTVTSATAQAERGLTRMSPGGEQKIALVIGNSKYPEAPLRNAANDARAMAASLRQLGFEVIEKIDVNQRELNRAISQFGSKLGKDSVTVFYYSGHGIQARNKNFLIPVDASISSESSIRSEAVDVDTVLEQVSTSQLNIVILDACRNNPFERGFRSASGGGLAQMSAPRGTLIAYATSPGQTAADGDGNNSPYTAELLDALRLEGLTVEQMFKRVRTNVQRRTGDRQVPWESSSLTGDFMFAGPAKQAPTPVPATATSPRPAIARSEGDKDDEHWNAIAESSRRLDFVNYLFKYPSGRHSDAAVIRADGKWVSDESSKCSGWFWGDSSKLRFSWKGACVDGKLSGVGVLTAYLSNGNIWTEEKVLSGGVDSGECNGKLTTNDVVILSRRGKCHGYSEGPTEWLFDGREEKFDASGRLLTTFEGKVSKQWKSDRNVYVGEKTFANGVKFKGTDNGEQSEGTVTYPSGGSIRCTFLKGKANGSKCEHDYADGRKFIGELKNGQRSGAGVLTLVGGAKVIGNWVNDKSDGDVTYVDKDGAKTQQRWIAGQRVK